MMDESENRRGNWFAVEVFWLTMKNAITIDLEDYYQVSAFANDVAVDQWDSFSSRIEKNTAKLLSIFDDTGAKATFFTLAWVTKRYPKSVTEIANKGHNAA